MFGQRLKEIRKAKRITQTQLATALNVANGTVAMWETGKREPDLKTIRRVADVLEVPLSRLIDDKVIVPPATVMSGEQRELSELLQKAKDEYGIMFDLAKGATLEEIKATVAFLKALREQE